MSQGGGGNMGASMGGNPLAQLFGGIFGNSGAPYSDAMDQFQKYFKMSQGAQNPFLQAGQQGMGNYQNWLSGMQDPSKFINNQMNNYQASPWSQFEQQQAMRAGQNAGSAGGLTGSSPLTMQMQQNAGNIASGDMNQWLQNVLGVNTQYGAGQAGLMNTGQHAADMMSQLSQNMGMQMGSGAYGEQAGKNQDFMNIIGGLFGPGFGGMGGGGGGGMGGMAQLFSML